MKNRKKLLAFLLSILVCAGAGAGARAAAPEEEARALLTQTMEDLRGDYTMTFVDTNYFGFGETVFVHRGEATALIGNQTRWLPRLLLGKRVYRVYGPEGALLIFPGRKLYARLPNAVSGYEGLLEPKEITPDTAVRAYRDGGALVAQTGEGVRVGADIPCIDSGYIYEDGALVCVWGPWHRLRITGLRREADASVFSTQGMRELPAWIYRAFQKYL